MSTPVPTAVSDAEWRVLRAIAVDDLSGAGQALADPGLDWPKLLSGAVGHRLFPSLATVLGASDVDAPRAHRPLLDMARRATSYTADFHASEAVRVTAALERRGIRVAVTKGTALAGTLYDGDGTRWFGDLDLMVSPDHADLIPEALADVGLAPGQPDASWTAIVPLGRDDEMAYVLSPDHVRRHAQLTGDPLVPVLNVDVAYSLTWSSAEWQVPMDRVMDAVRVASVGRHRLPVLADPHHFLFVVLHVFREAWFARTRRPDLAQARDVVRFLHRLTDDDRAQVQQEIEAWTLERPVSWVLGNLDDSLGTDLARRLGLAVDADWLRSATGPGNRPCRWASPLVERMRDGRWETTSSEVTR